jgi:hypothetical protein
MTEDRQLGKPMEVRFHQVVLDLLDAKGIDIDEYARNAVHEELKLYLTGGAALQGRTIEKFVRDVVYEKAKRDFPNEIR